MSVKNNSLVAAAALALGFTIDGSPVVESLLNDLSVTAFGVHQVDSKGRVLAIVTTVDAGVTKTRAVADTLGNVRLFADANSALSTAKKSNFTPGAVLKVVLSPVAASVGDPIAALKTKYKSYKTEEALGIKQKAVVEAKRVAGAALGWDTATGTPENTEYLDLVARIANIQEWLTRSTASKATLATALTAAGVDPATVV